MSATTTDNPIVTTVQQDHLEDYTIRLTGGRELGTTPAPPSTENVSPAVENPEDWPDQHRQVPPYRPVNRNLNPEARPMAAGGPVVLGFVGHMFVGVWLQATASWAWRQTGGKLNDNYFRHKVGGEI